MGGKELGQSIQLTIKDGLLVSATGDSASAEIESFLEQSAEALRGGKGHLVRTFSEFSFGMNPRARRALDCWRTNVGVVARCSHSETIRY